MPYWHRPLRVVQVDGSEAHHLLNLLLTQQLADLALPAAREWLWLEAKGAIIAAGTALLTNPETALLIVDEELATPVMERLLRFRFSLKAEIAIRNDLAVYSMLADGPLPADQYPLVSQENGQYTITYPYGYCDVLAPADALAGLNLEDGWDDWRVSAGVPVWGEGNHCGHPHPRAWFAPYPRPYEEGLLPRPREYCQDLQPW